MKKIKALILICFVQFLFFVPNVLAVVGKAEVETSNENLGIISNFFTKDLFINLIFAFIVMLGTYFLSKILTYRLTRYLERTAEGEGSNKEALIGVLTRTINISLLTIGFMMTLGILGIDTGILMGGIGFGLGFALKIFLTNFLAGILMVTQGYYHIGDLIKIGNQTGKIITINALFTSVQQFDGVVFYVPNVTFMEENVCNYHSNDKRRVEIEIGVDYDTDIVKAKKIIMNVLEKFPNILQAPDVNIFVQEFGDNSIKLSIRFWINSTDKYFVTKSNVTETINLAFKKYGIVIPFPQVTISNRNDTIKDML